MGARVVAVIAIVLVSFGAGALAYSAFGTAAQPSVTPTPAQPEDVEEPPPPPPSASSVPVKKPEATTEVKMLRLPDGSEIEPLNGVTVPADFTWGQGEYSPIVGTEHGNGVDWYVHADGTRSTTIEVWRNELGRLDPVTLVYRAGGPPVTVDPGK